MRKLYSAIRNRQSTIESWLPDMDLNHDKQIQSLLCYRYTIGQAGAFDRLNAFSTQSSQQTSVAEELNGVDARPHPGPLPQGEGEAARISQKLDGHNCPRRPAVIRAGKFASTCIDRIASRQRIIPPLLGERAGVRADVTSDFSASRITFHVSGN